MLLNDNLRATTLRAYTERETETQAPLLNFFLERYEAAYRLELDAFVDAVIEGKPMPVSARDGRQALRLADAALESAETGRLVEGMTQWLRSASASSAPASWARRMPSPIGRSPEFFR